MEAHAVGPDGLQHVAKAAAAEPDAEYQVACALAESAGVDLEDGWSGRATSPAGE